MLAKRPTSPTDKVITIRHLDRQLEDLYARKSAIDSLIESLEDYDRFRAKRVEVKNLKTA